MIENDSSLLRKNIFRSSHILITSDASGVWSRRRKVGGMHLPGMVRSSPLRNVSPFLLVICLSTLCRYRALARLTKQQHSKRFRTGECHLPVWH